VPRANQFKEKLLGYLGEGGAGWTVHMAFISRSSTKDRDKEEVSVTLTTTKAYYIYSTFILFIDVHY
jgi:hypothetical protein